MNITEYMYVNFVEFMDIIDYMGGVVINVQSRELNELNKHVKWMEKECERDIDKVQSAGKQTLSGGQALAYARIRKIDNDFYRTNRQRTVLNKLLEKCKTRSVGQLYDLMKTVLPMITTDMQEGDILGYAAEILPIVSELQVVTQHIPAEGTYTYDNKGTEENPMYVIIPDIEANRKLLEDLFN
jgi:anionic cell wall polymer biosynthesis LytR-Cps2A-Psr (LCP) family protein